LAELSARFGFDLLSCLDSLADSGTPVWAAHVDDIAAPSTSYLVARYKLAERLQGVLAALRVIARNSQGDPGKVGIGQVAAPGKGEITRAMISAGAEAYWTYDARFEDVGDAVVRIWNAMHNARTEASCG